MSQLPDDAFEGVILAAGRGTRMQPFSERYPKPLLPILNKPLIQHQVEYLRALGVHRVYIVIGHLGHEIALSLGRGEALGVQIEYVEQRDALGIAHALTQLERRIERPFALLLGDIYFETDRSINPLAAMRDRRAKGFLSVMEESDPRAIQRNFSVSIDDDHRVRRVIEKPRFPNSRWKGCGVYAFDISFFDALRRTPRSAARNEYELTDAIQTFIDDGAMVTAGAMMTRDINLTFPYDLLVANLSALRLMRAGNLVAPTARVHPGAQLTNSIIGERVTIEQPIRLRHVLAFPDARIGIAESIERAIVTPDDLVDCKYWVTSEGQPLR
ncbi:MAG: NTP transferase domain-containing protein [Planctomycetes bacterium]|nr:NTP transferase domain-containing protein [Planctomycetota bacterium]